MFSKPFALVVTGVALAGSLTACGNKKATVSQSAGSTAAGSTAAASSSKAGDASVTTVKIMVGGLNKQIYLPTMLTQNLGFFEQQGIKVELSDEPAGVDAEVQLLAGNVNGVVGFYDHAIDLQAKGKSIESVVQLLQVPGEVELCRTDLKEKVKSPADWSGRKLGVTGLGSSTNFLTKYLAVKNGVDAAKTTSVAVQAGNTFIGAMEHKSIDCGMTTEPTISALLGKNLAFPLVDMRTVAGAKAALGGLYPASCLYMDTAWVNSHKETVQKLVNAFVQTQHWIAGHSAAEITDKMPADYYAGVGKDVYVKALDAEKEIYTKDGIMPAGGPETVLQVLSAFSPNVKGKTIDLTKTYTTEFAQKANETYK